MLNRKSLLLVALSFCLVGATASSAKAQCNTTPVVIDLTGAGSGTSIGSPVGTNTNPQITVGPFAGPLTARQTVVTINLAGCRQANIVVEYEGQPSGWTAHTADSPTSDGFGGDGGTTINNAEVQIVDETMAVYSADTLAGAPQLLRQDLSLTDSAIKFVVRNQFLSWGQAYGFLQSPDNIIQNPAPPHGLLFAIPDTASMDGSRIYLGLNRVVLGPGTRIGSGARRAIITLQ